MRFLVSGEPFMVWAYESAKSKIADSFRNDVLRTISLLRYGSRAAESPSGSAPRKRPTALSASAQIITSVPTNCESNTRCAGSLS